MLGLSNPAPNATGIPTPIPPKLKPMSDPRPPILDPGFMAMAINLLCSASLSSEPWRPARESMRIPDCGRSQLRGVEYKPSRGGTSCGGTVLI